MIDEALANRAIEVFARVVGDSWPRPEAEIMDDGTFVLLKVDVPRLWNRVGPSDEERMLVVSALNEVLPIPQNEPVGAWMVVFKQDGNVYESILANEF